MTTKTPKTDDVHGETAAQTTQPEVHQYGYSYTSKYNPQKGHELVSFGVFLLFIGTLTLLTNLNVIQWGLLIDFFLRYWPVFIIVAGIKVIGNSQFGRYFGLIIDILFFVAVILGLIYAKDQLLPNLSTANNTVGQTKTIAVPFSQFPDALSTDYQLTFGAANFTVTDTQSDKFLTMTGSQDFTVVPTLAGMKTLQIDAQNNPTNKFLKFANFGNQNKYTIDLGSPALTSNMEVTMGASTGTVTLANVKLDKFSSKVGAGDLTVSLSGQALSPKIELNVGAGKTTLVLNSEQKVRINYSLGAGSLKLVSTAANLNKEFGGIGATGTYETSANPDVEVNVAIGAGAVVIQLN